MQNDAKHQAYRSFQTFWGSFAGKTILQAALLLAGIGVLTAIPAGLLLGPLGVVCALIAIVGVVILAVWLPPDILMRFYRAQPIDSAIHAQLLQLATELSRRANLHRTPHLFVVTSSAFTAFSLGNSDRSAIAVTEGVLRDLTMREIAGVIAHEVAHIRNGDTHVFSIADMLTRLTQVLFYAGIILLAYNLHHFVTGQLQLSWWAIAVLVLAPMLFNLFQLALPRAREFDADKHAAMLTGDPMGLASAVSRLNTSTGQIYQDLISLVPARRVPQPSLLRCHPATEQRLNRLRSIDVPAQPPLDITEGPRISLIGVGPIEMRPRYRWPGVWF